MKSGRHLPKEETFHEQDLYIRRAADRAYPAAGTHPHRSRRGPAGPGAGQAGILQPRRFGQGPRSQGHAGPGRSRRPPQARVGHHRTHFRQHRHRPVHDGGHARLPGHHRHARDHERRAPPADEGLRRGTGAHRGQQRHGRGHRQGRGTGSPDPRQLPCRAVREPRQPGGPQGGHRPRDLAGYRRPGGYLRGRGRYRRHRHRRGRLPEREVPRRAGGGGGTRRLPGAGRRQGRAPRPAGHRRGLRARSAGYLGL